MRQQLSYQWLRVAFLCTSYLPARLLSLPYLAHVLWLWCQNWHHQIVSPSCLHFGGVTQTLVVHDKVMYSAPTVAEEVAVGGSLGKQTSPLLSSWLAERKYLWGNKWTGKHFTALVSERWERGERNGRPFLHTLLSSLPGCKQVLCTCKSAKFWKHELPVWEELGLVGGMFAQIWRLGQNLPPCVRYKPAGVVWPARFLLLHVGM